MTDEITLDRLLELNSMLAESYRYPVTQEIVDEHTKLKQQILQGQKLIKLVEESVKKDCQELKIVQDLLKHLLEESKK